MTNWGAWVYANGNGARIGWDAAFTPGTNQLNCWITIQTQYRYSGDVCTLNWNGSFGGSQGATINTQAGQTQGIYAAVIGNQAYNSTSTTHFSVTGLYNGVVPTVDMVVYLGGLAPNPPTNVVGSWVSDTQINVSWTDNPAADRPYDSVGVSRFSNVEQSVVVASLGGAATYYSDTGLQADRRYQYQVWATNGAGTAYSTPSGYTYTTPAAPTNCAAVKTGGGDITVTWTNVSSYAAETQVEVWHAANGVWDGAPLTTIVAGAPATYTHVAPSTLVTHTYRVRAKTPSGTTRYSAYATSNVVQLLAAPNAPTGLTQTSSVTQNGTVLDASGQINLTWVHNPVDATPQSAYQIVYQVSTDNGSTWGAVQDTGKVTSTASVRNNAISTVNGRTVRWQVRTWGGHTDSSPYSAYSTFTTNARPVATATGGATVTVPVMAATGTYYDAEGSAQTGAQWSLYQGGTLLETATFGMADSSHFLAHTFNTPLSNGTTYVVAYRVQDSAGLWSTTATRNVTVAFTPPEVPSVSVMFDDYSGHIVVTVNNPAMGEMVESNTLRRRINGGEWGVLADDVAPNGTFTDRAAPVRGLVEYQATAYTALPSSATGEIVPLQVYSILDADDTCDGRTAVMSGWLTAEDGTFCRAYYDLSISETFDKVNSSLVLFSGAEYEEEISGRAKIHELGVAFTARYGKYLGATLRTNLHRNPSVTTDASYWTKWDGTGGSATGVRLGTGGYSGPGFYRVTWSVAAAARSGGIITWTYVPVNKPVTMSMYVRPSLSRTFRPEYQLYAGALPTGSARGASVLCPANQWTQLTINATSGDADTEVQFRVYSDDPLTLPINFTLDADACLIEVDAPDTVFFDGSSMSTDTYVYGWAGSVGGSPSYAYPRPTAATVGRFGTRASTVDEWRTLFKKTGQFWWRDYYGNSFPVKVLQPKIGDREPGGVTPVTMTLRRVSGATIHLAQESE